MMLLDIRIKHRSTHRIVGIIKKIFKKWFDPSPLALHTVDPEFYTPAQIRQLWGFLYQLGNYIYNQNYIQTDLVGHLAKGFKSGVEAL